MAEVSSARDVIRSKRILVVEDDAVVGKVYQRRLIKAGFEVTLATEGGDGFFNIVKDKPDGVLLDLMLPQMDGLEILRKTRAQTQFQKTPIIVFSNAFMSGMLQDAAEAGATMVVNKSDSDAIETIVEAFLDHLCRARAVRVPEMRVAAPVKEASPRMQVTEEQAEAEAPEAAAPSRLLGRRFGFFPLSRTRNQAPTASTPHKPRIVLTPPASRGGSSGLLATPARAKSLEVAAPKERSPERDILSVFFDGGNETIAAVRSALRDYQKDPSSAEGRARLEAFYRNVHRLTGVAAMCSSESISNFSACLEAMLHELLAKPDSFRPSTLKTLAAAVDILCRMFSEAGRYECPMINHAMALVIDEDLDSQRAMTMALQKARLHAMCAADGDSALQQLREVLFELIFLEAAMPGVDGFELCGRIREIPGYEKTPIVFVTGKNDLQSRARSITSGGNDFISKPLCRIEMSVKALTFVMKGRLAGATLVNPVA
jgi:CheY-like chemotaxis protein